MKYSIIKINFDSNKRNKQYSLAVMQSLPGRWSVRGRSTREWPPNPPPLHHTQHTQIIHIIGHIYSVLSSSYMVYMTFPLPLLNPIHIPAVCSLLDSFPRIADRLRRRASTQWVFSLVMHLHYMGYVYDLPSPSPPPFFPNYGD
jgi:hypothetical protein